MFTVRQAIIIPIHYSNPNWPVRRAVSRWGIWPSCGANGGAKRGVSAERQASLASRHDEPFSKPLEGETFDIFESIARVLTQIPEPRQHGSHYFGAYA